MQSLTSSKRILVVHHDPFVLCTRIALARLSGHEVVSACSPAEAEYVLEAMPFDLVVFSCRSKPFQLFKQFLIAAYPYTPRLEIGTLDDVDPVGTTTNNPSAIVKAIFDSLENRQGC